MQRASNNKLSGSLAAFLDKHLPEKVDVIIELSNSSKPEYKPTIEELKGAFHDQADAVTSFIHANGGNVTDSAWINKTIQATLPSDKLSEVANLEAVSAIDLPRTITPD